jgi:excisionase family DNA binding protein
MESQEIKHIEASTGRLPRLLLRPTEAAQVLGVSRATLYRLLDNGSLGSVWVRTLRRIPMAEVERYIAELVAVEADGAASR